MSQSTEKDAATIIGQHQRITGKSGHPCWCQRWPDHVRRDGQGWHEHLAEELAVAGLLVSSPPERES
jgi:hypothetical protein